MLLLADFTLQCSHMHTHTCTHTHTTHAHICIYKVISCATCPSSRTWRRQPTRKLRFWHKVGPLPSRQHHSRTGAPLTVTSMISRKLARRSRRPPRPPPVPHNKAVHSATSGEQPGAFDAFNAKVDPEAVAQTGTVQVTAGVAHATVELYSLSVLIHPACTSVI